MKTRYFILFITVGLMLSGCKKDFLETEPTEQVSGTKLQKMSENPAIAAEIIEGLIPGMYSWLYTPKAGGTAGDADFGQRSIDLFTDILCGDFIKTANDYGWHGDLQRYKSTVDYTNINHYTPWRYYFRLIFTANGIIDSMGGADAKFEASQTSARHQMGQALVMRGHAYYYLAQLFAPEYRPNDQLCPIYTTTVKVNNPVSTQKEVYDLIISDLEKAKTLLADFQRANKSQFNADLASAFLALTYAAMGQYDKVETLTAELMAKPDYAPMTAAEVVYDPVTKTGGGFNDVNVKDVMWGTDINPTMNIGLYSWWGQCDIFTYSYAVAGEPKCIDDKLYDSMRQDDVRRKQFGDLRKNFGSEAFINVPYNKFFHADRKISGQRAIDADYIYMRVSEMHLLNAEAKAFLNKDDEAKAVLKNFLKERITDLSYLDALTGQALKDEIYKQFRLEFVGEGKSYLALKRFKATVHTGKIRFDAENREISIPYDDKRMYFKIPENERLNNPNLGLNL
ncbi:RagB/SusD family nutrient uptake outer membrane protein [Porphyromonas sp.]|uniref:RagB/SusD family nutrient uptake outer membrane protein n=1 Tax=Porphyromonas sp. TaxID=1924944 RepID=UPI0026DB3852|nr:RagB/SusD family nutrient uptake outer membrane protein [Porphyromonas sp.]MDO4770962.1 RagB/SusD family nutrient uptake outer membrane protein [Porphyromonas sp.]